jgi:small subunit ribosomal protein S24e
MKIEVLQETQNKPLGRKEVEFRLEHRGTTTPSREDVHSKIVAQYDADPSTVVIKVLKTKFGAGVSTGEARIYEDAKQMEKVELKHIINRHASQKAEE